MYAVSIGGLGGRMDTYSCETQVLGEGRGGERGGSMHGE